ncbi:hypothetical protein, partial [Escherichia coli]
TKSVSWQHHLGQLSRAQQVLGIGYLYVEAQLRQI